MKQVDNNRRRFLTITTSFIAGLGLTAVSVPFLGYWNPSEKAKASAAPVTVNISKIQLGSMITVPWQGKPVWILRRNQSNLDFLKQAEHKANLRDPNSEVNQQPDYAKNEYRSMNPEIFIAVGICTHLGCVPLYKPDGYDDNANALYFCPCHGSKFDLAGRVFKGVPAPTNLIIPPHRYLQEDLVEIGRDETTLA
jgi:ubiquinol-cytochrome c reductase iron-sulfur subunit